MDSDESYKGRPMAVATKTTTASVLLFFYCSPPASLAKSPEPKNAKGDTRIVRAN